MDRAHNRQTRGRGLHNDIWKTFGISVCRSDARRDEQRGAPHPLRHLVQRQFAKKADPIAQLSRLSLQPGAQRSLADDRQFGARDPSHGLDQHLRSFFFHQPSDMEDEARLTWRRVRLEAIEINAVMMSERPRLGITARDRSFAQRIRHGKEQRAIQLQSSFPECVAHPTQSTGPKQRAVRSRHVIAAQAGYQWNAERLREWQSEETVGSEMGVDQRRPRSPQLCFDASAAPAQAKRQPLACALRDDHSLAQSRERFTFPFKPNDQRPPTSQRRRLVLDEALRCIEGGAAKDCDGRLLLTVFGPGHESWSTATHPDTSRK